MPGKKWSWLFIYKVMLVYQFYRLFIWIILLSFICFGMYTVMLVASWTTCSCLLPELPHSLGQILEWWKSLIWLRVVFCALFYIEAIILGKLAEKNPSLNINVKELCYYFCRGRRLDKCRWRAREGGSSAMTQVYIMFN